VVLEVQISGKKDMLQAGSEQQGVTRRCDWERAAEPRLGASERAEGRLTSEEWPLYLHLEQEKFLSAKPRINE
jgi:hypothetical protein